MNALTLPTRKAEEWRYSDLDALAAIWPTPAPTRIDVAAGENARHHLLQDAADGAAAVHDYAITVADGARCDFHILRSEEHTSELQSLMRISYAVFCLKKKNNE